METLDQILDAAFLAATGKPQFKPAPVIIATAVEALPAIEAEPKEKPTKYAKWPFAGIEPIGGEVWAATVLRRLKAGYGVEDIAVYMGCHVSHVRREMLALRATGVFEKWWR